MLELISTLKKKAQVGSEWSNILPESQARKKATITTIIVLRTCSIIAMYDTVCALMVVQCDECVIQKICSTMSVLDTMATM